MHRHIKSIITSEAFHDLIADMVVKEAEWMDEAHAERAWEIFVKRADVHERRFRDWMLDVFARQERQVIANINANSDPSLRGSPVRGVITKDIIDVWLFSADEWVDDMKSIGGLYMTDALAETGQAALGDLVLDASFNVADPRAQAFIQNRSFKFATDVNAKTQDALRANLAEGLAGGESIPELRNRVIDVFTNGYSPLDVRASKVRAEMIARSEIIRASNAGAELGYMQSGVVEAKEWYAAIDERTCLPADTIVNTADGDRYIQYIKVGDKVLSGLGFREVTDTMCRVYDKRLYGIAYADRNLEATADHLVMERHRGWVEMQYLNSGDEVTNTNNFDDRWYTITGTYISHKANQCVYNLEVEGAHTYYANGILVHNCPWCMDMHGATMGLGVPFFEQGDVMIVDGSTIKLDYEEVRHPPLHPRCYSKDTMIHTKQGWKLVKDVGIGTEVATLEPNHKRFEWGKVVNTVSYKQGEMLHITDKHGKFDMMVTPDHPFFGYKLSWRGSVPVEYCSYGDLPWTFYFQGLGERYYLRHLNVEHVQYNDMVYDVEVDRNHTILVSRGDARGIWGSNCRCTLLPVVFEVTGRRTASEARAQILETAGDRGNEVVKLTTEMDRLLKESNKLRIQRIDNRDINKQFYDVKKQRTTLRKKLNKDLLPIVQANPKGFDVKLRFIESASDSFKKNVEIGIKEFTKLIDPSIIPDIQNFEVGVIKIGRRASADGRIIKLPKVNPGSGTIIHETGHVLENYSDDVLKKAESFFARRTQNESSAWLGKPYNTAESGKKDKFIDAYVGRQYAGKRSTEIISMGFEYMYEQPYRLAIQDPDMFDFIYNLARGK